MLWAVKILRSSDKSLSDFHVLADEETELQETACMLQAEGNHSDYLCQTFTRLHGSENAAVTPQHSLDTGT